MLVLGLYSHLHSPRLPLRTGDNTAGEEYSLSTRAESCSRYDAIFCVVSKLAP